MDRSALHTNPFQPFSIIAQITNFQNVRYCATNKRLLKTTKYKVRFVVAPLECYPLKTTRNQLDLCNVAHSLEIFDHRDIKAFISTFIHVCPACGQQCNKVVFHLHMSTCTFLHENSGRTVHPLVLVLEKNCATLGEHWDHSTVN